MAGIFKERSENDTTDTAKSPEGAVYNFEEQQKILTELVNEGTLSFLGFS